MLKSYIICIDDQETVLESLRLELKEILGESFQIETLSAPKEAILLVESLLTEGHEIPVLICNYGISDMRGDELLTRIHRISPDTRKILFIDSKMNPDGITYAINHADLYRLMTKPWDRQDLEMSIRAGIQSYYQQRDIEKQNHQMQELNQLLEKKVAERTLHLRTILKELERKTGVLAEKSEDVEASIRYAQRIQQAILPSQEFLQQELKDYFLIFRPRDVVSGDFYWCHKIEKRPVFDLRPSHGLKIMQEVENEKIVLAVVDCTGHGVPGAFMSMIGNDLLNQIVIQEKITDPALLLSRLNEGIHDALRQQEAKNADGMDISICVIDTEAGTLSVSSAKQKVFYFQAGELYQISGDRASIGGYFHSKYHTFKKHQISLRQETVLYLFTDGIRDQFGGPQSRIFSSRRLKNLLKEVHTLPMAEQKNIIAQKIDTWMQQGQEKQIDDMTLLGVRFKPFETPPFST